MLWCCVVWCLSVCHDVDEVHELCGDCVETFFNKVEEVLFCLFVCLAKEQVVAHPKHVADGLHLWQVAASTDQALLQATCDPTSTALGAPARPAPSHRPS